MLIFLALLQTQATLPTPTVEIPRIEAEVTLDGVLDEPVWSQAAVLSNFRQYEPIDGRPAEERTEVLVWYAPDAIHFGIRAYDSQPQTIRATRADRDNIGSEDYVVIYLDTFNDRRRAFFFGANALGVQWDGVRTEGAASAGRMFGGNIDASPDYLYRSVGRLTPDGYVLEIRIPFTSLRYPSGGPQSWGLQVERKIQRTGYTDTWTDVRRANASFLLQSGSITGLHDMRRGMVFEAQPVLTAMLNGERDPATRTYTRDDPDVEVGANLRFGFSNVAIDATINPDFSQVEADASQVTVNERFALFFEEQRPFFLEGIELFSAPNSLVYTRRVVQPIAGGKVTGKVGPVGIAHLSAMDEGVGDGSDAFFNVTRLRTDLGANSLLGMLYTDRTERGSASFNRVAAGDLRVVFGRMYYLEAQAGGSWTRDPAGGEVDAGPIWRAEVDRTGRHWGFNYLLNGLHQDFETQSGFVNRTGIINGRAFNRLTWYGERGGLVETVTTIANANRIWDYDEGMGNEGLEGTQGVSTSLRLRGGWQLELAGRHGFVNLDPAEYVGMFTLVGGDAVAPYVPLDRVSGFSGELSIETPTYQSFNAELELSVGREAIFPEGSEGTLQSAEVELTLRPAPWIRTFMTGAFERLVRARDGSEFARTIIPRLKVEYQPRHGFFLRGVGEYRAERRSALRDAHSGARLTRDGVAIGPETLNGLRLDILAAYEPTPGTVAYLGYGATLLDEEAFRLRGVVRERDGVFVKLAYHFRR